MQQVDKNSPVNSPNGRGTLSIRRKLFWLRIGIGAAMGIIIGCCAVTIAGIVLYNSAQKDMAASLNIARHQVSHTINLFSNRVIEIATSKEAEKYYHTDREPVLYKLFEAYSSVFQHLSYINADSVHLAEFVNGKLIEDRHRTTTSDQFTKALNSPGKAVIQGPVWDPELNAFAITFYYRHIDYFDNHHNTLQASITLDAFGRILNEVFIHEKRYTLILTNDQDRIFFGPKPDDMGKDFFLIMGLSRPPGKVFSPGYLGRHKVYGERSYLAMETINDSGWKIFLVQPIHIILLQLGMVAGVTFLAVILCLTLGEILSKKLGFRLLEPIARLTQVMTDILDHGNLEQRVQWQAKDEMGQLAHAFNSMLDKIHTTQTDIQRQKTQQLQREIGKRKKDQERLRQAMVEAQASTKAKSEFLANMSHEIRTPMNGIIGMTELALSTALDNNQTHLITTIGKEAECLMDIINDVLDFSKIEAGKLELEEVSFNLRQMLEELCVTLALSAENKGLELILFLAPNIPERVTGDPKRLRQVLVNIAGNALKFTHQGVVFIRIDRTRKAAQGLEYLFSVSDTGIGIPQDQQDVIFESFSQADGSSTRQYGGSGLGTTISKQLVEMMGGHMEVQSFPGQGANFSFSVILKPDGKQPAAAAARGRANNARVLVATTRQQTGNVLCSYLTALGCRPVQAETGQAPSDWMLNDKKGSGENGEGFELIIIDEQLFAEAFSQHFHGEIPSDKNALGQTPYVPPVVVLTGLTASGSKRLRQHKLVSALVTKPVRLDQLARTLDKVCNDPDIRPGEGLSPDKSGISDKPDEPGIPDSFKAGLDNDDIRQPGVLLVEDYPTNQQVALRHLTTAGYRVTLAENGEQAVSFFENQNFDIILMDIQMPVLDGFESTVKIRDIERQKELSATPIIAMTAHAIKGYKEKCLEIGMDDYLTKPLKRDTLITMVEKWLYPEKKEKKPRLPDDTRITPPAFIPDIEPPLNIDTALYEFENDAQFLTETLSEFIRCVAGQIVEMKDALKTGNADLIMAHAHAIKGGSANLTALALSDAAADLEKQAKEDNLSAVGETLVRLDKEYSRLKLFVSDM